MLRITSKIGSKLTKDKYLSNQHALTLSPTLSAHKLKRDQFIQKIQQFYSHLAQIQENCISKKATQPRPHLPNRAT